ncbi:terminase large subunit [Paenibacillus ehimensis]|uniref:terminase large subunit n=1 Tax=Paenibacillus ehimensis TaxID=79264 RepID=UPI002DB883B4|nr:terminase TerL endonuclease subunit [Paenibacillus ehimensis]MEC0211813.1 terminase large subunit [Paenibacillus ehimensis]
MAHVDEICPVRDYAERVLSGEIPAAEPVRLACQRHLNDLRDSELKVTTFEYYFDEYARDHAINFFRFLRHSKGKWARQSFELELWQKFIVGSIFGWLHRETQLRRFRTAYEEIPRKNGKSTKVSGVGLYLTLADEEYGAEVYAAATKKDQAKITFDEASRMVRASPDLMKHFRVYKNNLHVIDTGSKFEPLGSDSNSLDGLNVHGGLIDEYHAHKNSAMYDVIESGTSAREHPLIYVITTAGVNQNGPCYQLREYAMKVLKGIEPDETFFAYIATIDDDDDPFDPATWMKANPNLGVSKDIAYMQKQAQKAKHMPTAYVNFLIKDLNKWVNAAVKWIPLHKWDESAGKIDLEALRGRKCYGGLDLSSKLDITAFALVFPPEDRDGEYIVLVFFWIPEDDLQERDDRDGFSYSAAIRDGLIYPTPGNVIDYQFIRKTINDLGAIYDIQEIGFDPWNATQTSLELTDDGFTCVPIPQNIKNLSDPTKEFEKLVHAQKLVHGGNRVLRWMVDNTVVRMDENENVAPSKKRSTGRIDGVAAIITAMARAINLEEDNVYEKRGMRSLLDDDEE